MGPGRPPSTYPLCSTYFSLCSTSAWHVPMAPKWAWFTTVEPSPRTPSPPRPLRPPLPLVASRYHVPFHYSGNLESEVKWRKIKRCITYHYHPFFVRVNNYITDISLYHSLQKCLGSCNYHRSFKVEQHFSKNKRDVIHRLIISP